MKKEITKAMLKAQERIKNGACKDMERSKAIKLFMSAYKCSCYDAILMYKQWRKNYLKNNEW